MYIKYSETIVTQPKIEVNTDMMLTKYSYGTCTGEGRHV